MKPIHPNIIPTVTGRRMNNDHTDKSVRKRRRCLITVGRQPSYNDTPQLTSVPSVYVLNAAALSKPHAIQLLNADLISYNCDVAVVTETHFKKSKQITRHEWETEPCPKQHTHKNAVSEIREQKYSQICRQTYTRTR